MAEIARKKVLLGITGGVAAYKAAELVRGLGERGVDVHVVMTEAALGFIGSATMQALSGNPVYTSMWDTRVPDGMAHIALSRDKDAIVVAPATADFIAKLASGLADDLLSTLCVARDCPLMIAPAMNRQMWEHPATRRNIAQLEKDGVKLAGPASGDQACGEVGYGRMLEATAIADAVTEWLGPQVLKGTRVLVTAGPTFEPIDPVRGITNASSGKMGYAVARAAIDAGAEVTLVSGPTAQAAPAQARRVDVTTAEEMFAAVKNHVPRSDIFVSVAAVADYRVVKPSTEKLKKSDANVTLELTPNPDILAYVAALPGAPFCVGFAAESEKLDQHADEKRKRKKIPLIAANIASRALGADDNEITLFDDEGKHPLPPASKDVLARQLVAHIAKLYQRQKK